MHFSTKNHDISDELLIYRFENGIKLIRPEEAQKYNNYKLTHDIGPSVASVLNLPLSIYLLDMQGNTRKMNHEGAFVCGFQSTSDSIGKSLYEVSKTDSANLLINNCTDVIVSNKIKLFDEENTRKDNTKNQFLSIKSPWYDDQCNIIGTFGCSIVLGKHPLADSLSLLKQLGFLSNDNLNPLQKDLITDPTINGVYLSKREMECLRFAVRGHTAKRTAQILGISYRTVEEYLDNIKYKLGAKSKACLIEMAIDYFLK